MIQHPNILGIIPEDHLHCYKVYQMHS